MGIVRNGGRGTAKSGMLMGLFRGMMGGVRDEIPDDNSREKNLESALRNFMAAHRDDHCMMSVRYRLEALVALGAIDEARSRAQSVQEMEIIKSAIKEFGEDS